MSMNWTVKMTTTIENIKSLCQKYTNKIEKKRSNRQN